MPALFVSDLDGTLLRNDATLSESSCAALNELLADGLVFSVASARSVQSMRTVLRGLALELPVIEFNGAFISDLATGRHEIVNAIDPAVAQGIFAMIQRHQREPIVSTFDGRTDRVWFSTVMNEGEKTYLSQRRAENDPRLRQIDRLSESLKHQVICLTVIGELEPLNELETSISEAYRGLVEVHLFENAYSPGWYWLTIHDRRATKDQAIRTLAASRNLSGHELIVFGDHLNDVKMFRIASHAVAVANAHPTVRAHATHTIGSNEQDSVVEYIRAFPGRARPIG